VLVRYVPRAASPGQRLRRAIRAALYLSVRLRLALDPEYPWLVHGAVKWLRGHVGPSMTGFEYGSGRSTLFFSRLAGSLVSVEHDAKWNRIVASRLADCGADNVRCLFMPPAEDASEDPHPGRPAIWDRTGAAHRKPEFSAYCDSILDYPRESFDFVLIDGRARVECALNAFSRIKPGGFLVLDNSEWEKYQPIFEAAPDWKRLDFENGVWRTSILVRPGRARETST